MSEKVDAYATKLQALTDHAAAILKERDALIYQASSEGLLEAVTKRISELASAGRSADTAFQSPPHSAARPAPAPRSSVALAEGQPRPAANQRVHVLNSPKAIIPRSNRAWRPRNTISQLQSRAVTESWEDGEMESASLGPVPGEEVSSADELLHERPKPAKAVKPAKSGGLAKQKRPLKLTRAPRVERSTVKVTAAGVPQLEHIDWVFWIHTDNEAGCWRPLFRFPSAVQDVLVGKFDADFLQKSHHVAYFSLMLRNREAYLPRLICVGNKTWANRNKPNKYRQASVDKEKTCDSCFNAGRLCARMVEVDKVVKLGFFPVPNAETEGAWNELHHWARKKE